MKLGYQSASWVASRFDIVERVGDAVSTRVAPSSWRRLHAVGRGPWPKDVTRRAVPNILDAEPAGLGAVRSRTAGLAALPQRAATLHPPLQRSDTSDYRNRVAACARDPITARLHHRVRVWRDLERDAYHEGDELHQNEDHPGGVGSGLAPNRKRCRHYSPLVLARNEMACSTYQSNRPSCRLLSLRRKP